MLAKEDEGTVHIKKFLNPIPDRRGEVQVCAGGEIFQHCDNVSQVILLNVVVSTE